MPLVRNHFGVWVLDEYVRGRRIRRSLHTQIKAIAVTEAEKLRRHLGAEQLRGRIRVDELVALYLDDSSRRNCADYWHNQSTVLDAMKKSWGRRYCDELEPVECNQYFLSLFAGEKSDHRSPETMNADLRIIRACFSWGAKKKLIPENPWQHVERMMSDDKPPRVLSIDEYKRVVVRVREYDVDIADLVEFLAITGLRRSEALVKLTWESVDFDRRVITLVGTKGRRDHKRKYRYVPITPHVWAILDRRKRDAYPFMRKNQHPWKKAMPRERIRPSHVTHMFKRLSSTAGVKGVSLHDLRRTFATEMAKRGIATPLLTDVLGHSDANTTQQFYIGSALDEISRVMTEVELLFAA